MPPSPPEFPDVYEDVRAIAHRALRFERTDHTLQPTEVVHEVYLRLARHPELSGRDRPVLIHWAAKAVRSVLIDHARARAAKKRGGDRKRVTLSDVGGFGPGPVLDVIALEIALSRLERLDPKSVEVVTLRFFGGLTEAETAEAMNRSPRWVRGQWAFARAWLRDALAEEAKETPADGVPPDEPIPDRPTPGERSP